MKQHILLPYVAATYSDLGNNIDVPVVFALPKTFNTPCSLLQTKTATLLSCPTHPTHSPPPPHRTIPAHVCENIHRFWRE